MYPAPGTLDILAPMNQPRNSSPDACAGLCDQCVAAPLVEAAGEPGALAGGRMVLASSVVFLLPLAAAIAGAAWVRNDPPRQLVAALAGFAAGVAAAVILVRLIHRPKRALS